MTCAPKIYPLKQLLTRHETIQFNRLSVSHTFIPVVMPPQGSSQTLLSPAELSFLHSSLSSTPPIRPDLRTPTQFRPLVAETEILPSTNGSARICFSDGTEAIVGIKAEVERTPQAPHYTLASHQDDMQDANMTGEDNDDTKDTVSYTHLTLPTKRIV